MQWDNPKTSLVDPQPLTKQFGHRRLTRVIEYARALNKLDGIIKQQLPSVFHKYCRVANLKKNT